MKRYACLLLPLIFAVASCSKGPQTFIPGAVDSFTIDSEDLYQQANQILQADYIFTVDGSYSMKNKRELLIDSLSDFAQSLVSENIKYRIGFINGNVDAAQYSTISQSFIGGITIESSQAASLQNSFIDQLYSLGSPLAKNTTLGLEATLKTMQARGSSFVRPGSQLVYVFVSDTDDLSQSRLGGSRSASNYASSLKAFKPSSAFVSSRSIVITGNSGCTADPTYIDEKVGTRFMDTTRLLDAQYQQNSSTSVTACVKTSNFSALLDDLAQDVSKPTDKFELQIANFDPDTVHVYVNGAEKTKGTQWNLSGSTVVFTAGNIPGLSQSVRITYLPKFTLSVTPNLSNLVVTVNSVQYPQDATNGWTYLSSENRLVFHGSAVPSNGAVVNVAYTGN